MEIFIERTKEKKTMNFKGTVEQLLNKLNQNKEAVLVAVNDELVTNDYKLKPTDKIKILSVISGG